MIRLEMNRKQEAILAAIIVVAALAAFAFSIGIGRAPAPVPDAPPSGAGTDTVQTEHNDGTGIDYTDALESGNYLLDNPLVIVEPYNMPPLTALVLFQTTEPMRITVNVIGGAEDISYSRAFSSFETSHFIPVYGLYPDTANPVEIVAEPLSVLEATGEQSATRVKLSIDTGSIS